MTNLSKDLCEICRIGQKGKIIFRKRNWDKKVDFEQPENFVKLLKIANDVLGSVHFVTEYTKNRPGLFEEQTLLHYLSVAKSNEAFKQAIRAEKWKYE